MAEAVEQVLLKHNYAVDLSYDGQDGLDNALTGIYDAIVLDVMLPRRDGLSVLRELRQQQVDTPVVLLTALGQTEDKVLGLDSGADDYLTKPFQMDELLARLRALTRRTGQVGATDGIHCGDLTLDRGLLAVRCGGLSFKLTRKEAQLLEALMRNQGITLSPELLINKVWGFDSEAESRHVQVYISFLRKKLAQLGSGVVITTVRGVGYVLQDKGGAQ